MLSRRALNRALLERQLLLQRSTSSVEHTLEHLVGMQAQVPNAPYVGLWTRLAGFIPEQLADLISTRRAVRIALMRSTIHLVTGRDCLLLRPLVGPALTRGLKGSYGRRLAGIDMDELAAAGRSLVEERPRTLDELGKLLQKQWPDREPEALAISVRALVPLVQQPPRGIWGSGGLATHTSAEAWLGRPLARRPSLERLILRYLAAFGPATIADVQNWSGLNRLTETIETLRPRLRVFRDESGRALFDILDAPLPDPDTPAPPRFVPEYDNLLLGHLDRTRVIADEHRARIFTRGAVLVGGFVRAGWKVRRSRGTARLVIEYFPHTSKRARAEVMAEAQRLLAFVAPNAGHEIEITPAE